MSKPLREVLIGYAVVAALTFGITRLRDVPPFEVWAGVPARRLRQVEVPADLG